MDCKLVLLVYKNLALTTFLVCCAMLVYVQTRFCSLPSNDSSFFFLRGASWFHYVRQRLLSGSYGLKVFAILTLFD